MEQQPEIVVGYAQGEVRSSWPADVGYVGIKLIGLWQLVQAAGSILYALSMFGSVLWGPAIGLQQVGLFAYAAWPLVIGTVLVVFARPIADFFFRRSLGSPPTFDAPAVVMLLTVGLALWLIATSVPMLVYEAFVYLQQQSDQAATLHIGDEAPPRDYRSLAIPLIEVAIGIALFLRPGWVVGLFKRYSRTEPKSDLA